MSTLLVDLTYAPKGITTGIDLIRSKVNRHVYFCPIRLFDTLTRKVITREELLKQLVEAVVQHVSTPPTSDTSSEDDDPKVAHDRTLHLTDDSADLYPSGAIASLAWSYGRYATLSHRWSENELLFSDIPLLDEMEARKPEGYKKFSGFTRAVQDCDPLCRYLWVDTLCINKDSSAELDESIRSMYRWYENSRLCIVHLAQTPSEPPFSVLAADPWFRRGWTLQELLAPECIKFYASDWTELYPEATLDIYRGSDIACKGIVNATGIDSEYIDDLFEPSPRLAPLVFSWAAHRQTSRPEDIAYSLIGLLNVHLPIAYGEGEDRAFERLQVACLQSSPSRGLFSWDPPEDALDGYMMINSMLAPNPSVFTSPNCNIRCNTVAGFEDIDVTFSLVNGVLRITMWLLPIQFPTFSDQDIEGFLFNPGDLAMEWVEWQFFHANEHQDAAEAGNLVVGVFGFDGEMMHAVILKKMDGFWVRDHDILIRCLPSKSVLERSGVAPQLVFIK